MNVVSDRREVFRESGHSNHDPLTYGHFCSSTCTGYDDMTFEIANLIRECAMLSRSLPSIPISTSIDKTATSGSLLRLRLTKGSLFHYLVLVTVAISSEHFSHGTLRRTPYDRNWRKACLLVRGIFSERNPRNASLASKASNLVLSRNNNTLINRSDALHRSQSHLPEKLMQHASSLNPLHSERITHPPQLLP